MKTMFLLSTAAMLTLSACTQGYEDKGTVTAAAAAAQDAKEESIQASENARIASEEAVKARQAAEKAREAAERASQKADRIFREGQNK